MKKSKSKSENTLRQMKIKTQLSKIYGMQQSSSKRKVYSNTDLPQETRKISNTLTFHQEELEKEEKLKYNIVSSINNYHEDNIKFLDYLGSMVFDIDLRKYFFFFF